jgi:hypothetical protein
MTSLTRIVQWYVSFPCSSIFGKFFEQLDCRSTLSYLELLKIFFRLVKVNSYPFISVTFSKDVIMYCCIIIDVILMVHTLKTQIKVHLDVLLCL